MAAYSNLQTASHSSAASLASCGLSSSCLLWATCQCTCYLWYCSNSQNITVFEFILLVRTASKIFKKCWRWHYFHLRGSLSPEFFGPKKSPRLCHSYFCQSFVQLLSWRKACKFPSEMDTILATDNTKNSSCTLVLSYWKYFIILPLTHSWSWYSHLLHLLEWLHLHVAPVVFGWRQDLYSPTEKRNR